MSLEQHRELISEIVRAIRQSPSILFVTGAGISADSGIPTYRGVGGLYDVDVTEEGFAIEEVLSGPMFQRDPGLTWKYLKQIGEAAAGATFNRAHEVIAKLEEAVPRVWTLTQNVDGFHAAAGSSNVIEIHGNMQSVSCTSCGRCEKASVELLESLPPYCRNCDSVLRPDVVLFGEALPAKAVDDYQRELQQGFSLVVSVGTSGVFPYIQEPFNTARRTGVPSIEINPLETQITRYVDYFLPLRAAEALDAIWNELDLK